MKIEWNKVTWYSKVIAVVLFVATFAVAFYFGTQYEKVWIEKGVVVDENIPELSSGKLVLKVGQRRVLGGLTLTLNSVTNDSRCAVDVVCIWAGNVTVNVTLNSGNKIETINLTSDGEAIEFADYRIIILEVNPENKAGKPISPDEYRVTFQINNIK